MARNACTPICGDAGSCSPLEPQLLVVSKSKKGACERAKCMYTCQRTVRASRTNPRERWCIHSKIAFTCDGHIPFHTRRNACTHVNVHACVHTRAHRVPRTFSSCMWLQQCTRFCRCTLDFRGFCNGVHEMCTMRGVGSSVMQTTFLQARLPRVRSLTEKQKTRLHATPP